MAGEYIVPKILIEARASREMPLSERSRRYPPSTIFMMAEIESDGVGVARLLFNHAMIEFGFVGPPGQRDKTDETFMGYSVCPVCGVVLSDG